MLVILGPNELDRDRQNCQLDKLKKLQFCISMDQRNTMPTPTNLDYVKPQKTEILNKYTLIYF